MLCQVLLLFVGVYVPHTCGIHGTKRAEVKKRLSVKAARKGVGTWQVDTIYRQEQPWEIPVNGNSQINVRNVKMLFCAVL